MRTEKIFTGTSQNTTGKKRCASVTGKQKKRDTNGKLKWHLEEMGNQEYVWKCIDFKYQANKPMDAWIVLYRRPGAEHIKPYEGDIYFEGIDFEAAPPDCDFSRWRRHLEKCESAKEKLKKLWAELKTKKMDWCNPWSKITQTWIRPWREKVEPMFGKELSMPVHKFPEAVLACVKRYRWEKDPLYNEFKKYKEELAAHAVPSASSSSHQQPRQRQRVDGRTAFGNQIQYWQNQRNAYRR